MCRFDLLLALNAADFDVFRGRARGALRVALLRLIDDDAFELGFFVKEVRNVQERVAIQSNIDERRLHSR